MTPHRARTCARVESLSQYVEAVGDRFARWKANSGPVLEPVFRGQAKSSWPLVPALMRHAPFDKAVEDSLLMEFERGARPFVSRLPHNRLQWMALAQHHGLPTRLLDFSESSLAALYFALSSELDDEPSEDACVWMLNRNVLHRHLELADQLIVLDDKEADFPPLLRDILAGKSGEVLVFTPVHLSARMPVQKAAFALFGNDGSALESHRDDEELLYPIIIPRSCVRSLLREIELAGMTHSTLFPDLDGVATEVWHRALRRKREERHLG